MKVDLALREGLEHIVSERDDGFIHQIAIKIMSLIER
jgi:hypothetical protein